MLIIGGYEIQIIFLKKSLHIYVIGFVPASKPVIPIITLAVYISFIKAKCLSAYLKVALISHLYRK